jgi:cytochrome P450
MAFYPASTRPLTTDRLVEPHRSWNYAHELREALGDVFLIVSPRQIYLFSSNAETIMQMMTQRNDFVKPVEIYEIVDFYGSNILTTEGPTWKRHRKIMAPAFSEKSNAMVWKESLRQAEGMLSFWAKLDGNPTTNMTVRDVAKATALMTLHVISGAGFGVRQAWDCEQESELGINVVPGFNTAKLNGEHKLAFKNSLYILLGNVIWMAILPVWLLSK